MLQDQEFIKEFVEEAVIHLENVESGLLKIDTDYVNPDLLNDIFRAIHSIKGSAGFFDFKRIVELAHSMENVLGELRSGKLEIDQSKIELLLKSNDCLKVMINDLGAEPDISDYVQKLTNVLSGKSKKKQKPEKKESTAKEDIETEVFVEVNDADRQKIDDGLRYGQKLYKITANFERDLKNKDITPAQFIKKVESIGSFIDSNIDVNVVKGMEECPQDVESFAFLFMTVLEKNLLLLALDLTEESIIEMDPHKTINSNAITETRSEKADLKKEPEEKKLQTDIKSENEPQIEKNQISALDDSIRVRVMLLDNILNLASEMVLARNQLLRTMERYRKDIPGIDTILQNVNRITTELQEKVMQTRMQPIANVFNKFPRIIRDLSKKLGKDIKLNLEGADVELDKSIIESLADPLTHLVRNAADHGLEMPEERIRAGKPRTGNIVLKAYHEGGYVNIDVTDDGFGIDLEKVRKKAVEKDIVSRNDALLLEEQEVLQLLFKPGFSTSEEITDVSGRGVGMDVVKTNIEKLGGSIETSTKSGEGTTFKLLLPLTLAIIPSLIVEVEGQKFALPQVNLQEIVRIKPGDSTRKIENVHDSEVLRLRGKLLPIVHLSDVLRLNRTYIDPETNLKMPEKRKTLYDQRRGQTGTDIPDSDEMDIMNRRRNILNVIRILVLKIGSRSFGLAVDSIHGSEEILVKPLPKLIKECRCYSGVTILGDGKAAMILDPEGIISKASLKFIDDAQTNERDNISTFEGMVEQQNLLIFKCSGTETFGIDLSLVSRVEEIDACEIEKVVDKEYIKFRGDSLRVIRIENYLNVDRKDTKPDKYYVIIPKLVRHPMGILIEKIHDTIQTTIKLNRDDMKEKGIIGSTIINNKIVLLVNIYELFEKADPELYRTEFKTAAGNKRTILVVEDTPFFLKQEVSYLEAAGYNVLTARNGKEAFQILQEKDVDEVISDIQMPVMDGMELIKKIREDKKLAGLPVIAVTSMTGEIQRKKGIEAGFDFYEFKLDRVGLLEKVELGLNKKREVI